MARVRVNWNLIIVLFLAVIAVVVTGFGLRKYHRKQRAEVGLTEGLVAYEAGRWEDAASSLGQYLSIHPADIDILIKYAQSQYQIQPFKRQHLAQAINAYRVVLRLEDNELAANEIIKLYLQFGMPAEAELIARRFVEKTENSQIQQFLAVSLVRQRKYEEAVNILMQLVSQYPKQIIAFKLLGDIAEKQPEIAGAQAGEWFDKAIEKNPDSAQAYILRSTYLAKQGQIQAAREDIEKAEQCDLSDTRTRLSLGATCVQLGQYDRAQTHLEMIKGVDPGNEELWYIWGVLASEMGDRQQIIKIVEEGLQQLGRENYGFLPLAAELFVQADQIQRARECVSQLNEAEAERATILYLEGLISKATMDWATAIQKWQRSIQLGFSSEMVYLNLVDTLEQINNRPMAIQILRRYLSQSGESFKGHLKLAEILAKDQRWQEALDQAAAAVQASSVNLEARVLYLRCRIEMVDETRETDTAVLKTAIQNLIRSNDQLPCRMLMFHLAMRQDDKTWAEQVLAQIEEKYGLSEQIILSKAKLLMLQDKVAEGVLELEAAIPDFSDSSEIIKLLAWGYSRNSQYQKCIELLESAYNQSNDPFKRRKYRLWTAEITILEGKKDAGIQIYHQMAMENTSDIFARRQLLAFERQSSAEEQSQRWIDEIKTAEGEDGWQWKYEQARIWCKTDDDFRRNYAQIIEMLNENLNLNPDDQESRILLASCHERAGNIQLALSLYQDAMTKNVDNVDFIVAAVGAMYRAEEYRQAQEILTRVSQRGLWDPRLAKYELQNSLRVGQEDNALSVLEKMVAQSPDDYDAKLSLALLQIRNENFEEAQMNIQEVIEAQPNSVAATAAMADFWLKRQNPQEALKLCDSYLAENESLAAHTMRCHVLLNMNDIPGVLNGISSIQSKYGNDKDGLLVICRLYQVIGQAEESIPVIDRLLIQFGEDFAVQKEAALLFLSRQEPNRRNKGIELLEKALQQRPVDVKLRIQRAMTLIQQQNGDAFEQARFILDQLIREYPRLEIAWSALAKLSLDEQDPAHAMDYVLRGLFYLPDSRPLLLFKAQIESIHSPISSIATLKPLLEKIPQDSTIILMLSLNYRKAGLEQEALNLLQKSLSHIKLKESVELQNELMVLLFRAGQKEQAEEIYQKLVQQTSDSRVLIGRLSLLAGEKSIKDIRDAYQAWVGIYPDQTEDVLDAVISVLMTVDSFDEGRIAENIVKEALAVNPDSASACYAMGMLLHQTGRKIEAIPWYEKTIQLDPQQVIAMNNLAWILCTEKSEYHRALEIVQKGFAIDPAYVDLIDTRGVIYMHLGEYEKAVADFERCEKMYLIANPNKTASIFRLGQCLMQLKKDREALIELYKAKDLNAIKGGLSTEQLGQLESMVQNLANISSP